MPIVDIFIQQVERFKDLPCLSYKKDGVWRSLSWAEVQEQVFSIAEFLSKEGYKKGDKIGILSATRYEWTVIDLAILSIGATVVPIYTTLSPSQVSHILQDASVRAAFIENDILLRKLSSTGVVLEKIIMIDGAGMNFERLVKNKVPDSFKVAEVSGGDVASIIYTSGTTGFPKGVMISHDNIICETESLSRTFKLLPEDVMLTFLPLAHVLARAVQFCQIYIGCQAAYAESVEKVAQNLLEVRPHMTVVVPRFIEKVYDKVSEEISKAGDLRKSLFKKAVFAGREYGSIVRKNEVPGLVLRLKYFLAKKLIFSKLSRAFGGRLKFMVTGGAPLSPELARFFNDIGLLIIEGYGLTETFAAVTCNKLDDYHFGTVGKPLDGVQIKIDNDGEILIKGGMVFSGYYNLPEETGKAFTEDGWFKTGDVGEFSKDGFLRITDRKKDMIVTSNGKNIAPQVIEKLLTDSHYISHAVVFGEGRKFISAVVVLNETEIKCYAKKNSISFENYKQLARHSEIKNLVDKIVRDVNKNLSRFETIKKFAILDHEFTIETGELTPTMKVRRRLIEQKYLGIVEQFYNE